ncbi:MAG: hypothetical protein PHX34_03165 [Candidatus Shapirobacteria bacterium]|nr:hypothetical protein [Candidatus Shapirobacteria bacterium]
MPLPEIPTSITIGQQDLTFHNIHKSFAKTEIGKKLNNKTRWERYQKQGNDLANTDWINILGQDANNLTHGLLTYEFARLFIKHLNSSNSQIKLDQEEQKILLFTAISHDWPEGVTKKGDITLDLKTIEDEKKEINTIEGLITNLLGDNSLPIARQVKNVLEDSTSKLGNIFNAIEKIGYSQTGLNAWKKRERFDKLITPKLTLLSNNVLLNNIPKMIEYGSIYPPINSFLRNRQPIISDGFTKMPNSIFNLYIEKPDLQEINRSKFKNAFEQWNDWIKPRHQMMMVE